MAMETMRARLTGITPLIMMSAETMDPMSPKTREIARLTAPRGKKTDDVIEAIKRLEWEAFLYLDESGAVVVPTANIIASLRGGATQAKNGKRIDRGVMCFDLEVPLKHPDCGKSLDEMYAAGNFIYTRVVQSGKGIMKCRPMFRRWSLEVELRYQSEQVDSGMLSKALSDAGLYAGLGCWRPACPRGGPYGRYDVEVLACSEIDKPQQQNGSKSSKRAAAIEAAS